MHRENAILTPVVVVVATVIAGCGTGHDDSADTGTGGPEAEISATAVAGARPNILLIVADDLGVNDVSLNPLLPEGATEAAPISTPHIDRIGREGTILTQAFATHATCAPSRAALMTGRYQHRFGFEFNPGASGRLAQLLGSREYMGIPGRYFPEREARVRPPEETGLPPEEITLAEVLGRAGYRTAHFGKWHLGSAPKFRPENRGFDHFVGFYGGASLYAPADDPDIVNAPLPIDEPLWDLFRYSVVRNGEPGDTSRYQTDLWADEAIEFISADADAPFFVYLAFNAPHNPLQAPREIYDELSFIASHEARVYYAMVLALDRAIGRVLSALDTTGAAEDTLVVFASDNGGPDYTQIWVHNEPLRGYKGSFWDGGTRSPLFMRWPGVLPAGARFRGQTSLMDLFATFAVPAGAELPAGRAYDSVDLWPYLLGERAGDPHEILFWRSGDYVAVRDGRFKFKTAPRPEPGNRWLYRVERPMLEQENLAADKPDAVSHYRSLLEDHFGRMEQPRWGIAVELPVRPDPPAEDEDLSQAPPEYVYVSGG